jgi:hypothetical protein
MHGLWGVQCAAELLNNVHGEAGGRRGCEVPEFQLAGTGKGKGGEEFGCGNGDGDDGCESAWSRGEEGNVWKGKERVRIGI